MLQEHDEVSFLASLQRAQDHLGPPGPEEDPTEVIETDEHDKEVPPTVAAPLTTGPVNASNFLQHPDAHPIILDLLLLKKYGPEWLGWENETVALRAPEDFHQKSISEINLSKIYAAKALHLVDTFWQHWEVFVWCTMALNGIYPNFEVMQVPTVAQCLVAVDIANRLRDDVAWSDEVKIFIAMCYRHDCILTTIAPTTFVEIEPDPDLGYDFNAVQKRWPSVMGSEHAPQGQTVEDEQLRRMLIAHQFLEESRTRLRQQMPLVDHA